MQTFSQALFLPPLLKKMFLPPNAGPFLSSCVSPILGSHQNTEQ